MADSAEKIIEVLNEQFTPQTFFTPQNISFSQPELLEGTAGFNTAFTVSGIPGRGYYGNVGMKYNRIDLIELGQDIEIFSETGFTQQLIIDTLNGRLKAFIRSDDLIFEDFDQPAIGQDVITVITAAPLSLGWIGQTTVKLTVGKPSIEDFVSTTDLNVLRHPGNQSDVMVAWSATYYMDFTSYRDALLINPLTGTYSDGAVLQELTLRLGMPAWSANTAADYPTSAVPSANQSFDRVVVQNATLSNTLYGPLYFHYNLLEEV